MIAFAPWAEGCRHEQSNTGADAEKERGMVRLRRTVIVAGLAAALCTVTPSAAFATADAAAAPTVDVRAYGARGNGTHDDTAALRRAIRAVALLGGGTVRLPSGTKKR